MSRTKRNGERIDLTSRWLQLRDPRGRAIGIMETSADVTEQRRSHLERDHIEMRYTTIFQAAGFATWESDWSAVHAYIMDQIQGVEGDLRSWLRSRPDVLREAARRAVIQEANHAAVLLFEAKSAEELIGKSIVGDYVDGGEDGFVAILAGLAEGAAVVEADTRLATKSGREIDVVLRATLVPDGVPWSRALVMAFDETERKEARARLEKASSDLAHAARVSTLGQLTASIAHEVNQPLSAIVTYAKSGQRWLTLDTPDIPEALACLVRVVANGSRASEVIGRVRSQARNTPPQPETLSLATVAYEAVALVEREIRAARVTVRTAIPADLPEATGDRVQTQQVLVNLILNAAQAMAGSEAADREIGLVMAAEGDGFVRVAVEDRGGGIALDDPMTIFAPFFTTKKEGMGMGLSICKSIIEAQGGRIRARNNAQGGATISFTLPVAVTGALADALAHTWI